MASIATLSPIICSDESLATRPPVELFTDEDDGSMPVNRVARSELSFASGPFVSANKLDKFCCASGTTDSSESADEVFSTLVSSSLVESGNGLMLLSIELIN